jgi:hypothetical protein
MKLIFVVYIFKTLPGIVVGHLNLGLTNDRLTDLYKHKPPFSIYIILQRLFLDVLQLIKSNFLTFTLHSTLYLREFNLYI